MRLAFGGCRQRSCADRHPLNTRRGRLCSAGLSTRARLLLFQFKRVKAWRAGTSPAANEQRTALLATSNGTIIPAPLGLLAELTHRCPLGCPYCSNPLALDKRVDELDTASWARVCREAAALGVLQVHLSGGEPAARRDLPDIVKAAREAGLYSNLITSAVGLTPQTLAALAAAGLDHVQISIQDSDAVSADHIAGYKGASARKRWSSLLCRWARRGWKSRMCSTTAGR